ncbi:hypothetical protein Tco_0064062 [Tanacetum coccineum]
MSEFLRVGKKMFYYLTTLGLARFLKETAPQVEPPVEGQSSNAQDPDCQRIMGVIGTQVQNRGCWYKEIRGSSVLVYKMVYFKERVVAIIEKLPPSWVEFKNYLKHKRKEMSVEDLVVRLRIEEDKQVVRPILCTPDSARLIWLSMLGHLQGHRAANCKIDEAGEITSGEYGWMRMCDMYYDGV